MATDVTPLAPVLPDDEIYLASTTK